MQDLNVSELRQVQSQAGSKADDQSAVQGIELRSIHDTDQLTSLSAPACQLTGLIREAAIDGRSRCAVVWPQRLDDLGTPFALAAITRLEEAGGLRALYFPWSRSATAASNSILVNRTQLCDLAGRLLTRSMKSGAKEGATFSYAMAMQSLSVLNGRPLTEAKVKRLNQNPTLQHPTLRDITPHSGNAAASKPTQAFESYEKRFLSRLRQFLWVSKCANHLEAISNPTSAPIFLYGLRADTVAKPARFLQHPALKANPPALLLLDLQHNARIRLKHAWIDPAKELLDGLVEQYGYNAPAVVAVTEDAFVASTVRWRLIPEYDQARATRKEMPTSARLIINREPDLLSDATLEIGYSEPEVGVEMFATDVGALCNFGLELKRGFKARGQRTLEHTVAQSCEALRRLYSLPGSHQEFLRYLDEEEIVLDRSPYDTMAPYSALSKSIASGEAGDLHESLKNFTDRFQQLRGRVRSSTPAQGALDHVLSWNSHDNRTTLIVLDSRLATGFMNWRLDDDGLFAAVPGCGSSSAHAIEMREFVRCLRHEPQSVRSYDDVIFVSPDANRVINAFTLPGLPDMVKILTDVATGRLIERRIKALRQLPGSDVLAKRLDHLHHWIERALDGRCPNIVEFDDVPSVPSLGVLDLTLGDSVRRGEPKLLIEMEGGLQVRAYPGTELARRDHNNQRAFNRVRADHLHEDDRVCVFTPDFIETVRDEIHVTAKASETLRNYHRDVVSRGQRLPGTTLHHKAEALRHRMLSLATDEQVPGIAAVRHWLTVEHLLDAPLDAVRPHAPRKWRTFLLFMRALGVDDTVADIYWRVAIHWTRSVRIRSGAHFHSVFMSLLTDPYSIASRYSGDKLRSAWRVFEAAEANVARITKITEEGRKA